MGPELISKIKRPSGHATGYELLDRKVDPVRPLLLSGTLRHYFFPYQAFDGGENLELFCNIEAFFEKRTLLRRNDKNNIDSFDKYR